MADSAAKTGNGSVARVAVTGGRGMLGTEVVTALQAAGVNAVALDLPEFDLCNPANLTGAVAAADAIINCAAYTNVDRAESEPSVAAAVNAEAVGRLGELAARLNRYVLHISTDFVFDGSQERPYRESDAPHPLSVYGATKLAGEHALAASGCRHAIVRVEWTYGASGNHFIRKLLERARSGSEIRMVTDQIGSPTWTREVAGTLARLLAAQATGMFHYAAAGYASRLDVAHFLLRELEIERELLPCRTADLLAPAQRPLSSRFDCRKIEEFLGQPRRHWRDTLREFLRTQQIAAGAAAATLV